MGTLECTHQWKIESPKGTRYVQGECILCFARRLFRTSWPERTSKKKEVQKRIQAEMGRLMGEATAGHPYEECEERGCKQKEGETP